jgi:molecular chaperone GrpE
MNEKEKNTDHQCDGSCSHHHEEHHHEEDAMNRSKEQLEEEVKVLTEVSKHLQDECLKSTKIIQELQTKCSKLVSEYANLNSEYEGAISRHAKAIEEANKYAYSDFALVLVSALDMFELSLNLTKDNKEVQEGLRMVYEKLVSSLAAKGIRKVATVPGTRPDPDLHCVVKQEKSEEITAGNIVSILQDGYHIHDRILRPASVVVAEEIAQEAQ